MSRTAVARTYADTLLELAEKDAGAKEWLEMLSEVVGLYESSSRFAAFLDTPRVSEEDKEGVLREVFGAGYPENFVRFLLVVLRKRRQRMLPQIDEAARDLLNERTGRLHATVTLMSEPDEDFRREIERELSRVLDREVDADFRTDPRLVGGMVVRAGDRVLDGSVRRRLQTLRRSLLETNNQSVG
ncbi:MAG: ATP synthase F1 subunit delta [Gemmatimonadota bacterium]